VGWQSVEAVFLLDNVGCLLCTDTDVEVEFFSVARFLITVAIHPSFDLVRRMESPQVAQVQPQHQSQLPRTSTFTTQARTWMAAAR